jgi:hypothetical protein
MTQSAFEDSEPMSPLQALRGGQQRVQSMLGQLDSNQGQPTFTGRLTLDQLLDLTVVHNRKWATDAGESLDTVTQRELIDAHAADLATFIMQGLVSTTIQRAKDLKYPASMVDRLEAIQKRIGWSAHYGLPQITLVLPFEPEVRIVRDGEETIAAKLIMPAGRRFVVADGQHRREATHRVRTFLNEVISNRRTPKAGKVYPAQDAPLTLEDVEAWIAVQETFSNSTIAYEAHIGLSIPAAKQMFTNYNSKVRPVAMPLNLAFDQSNPINRFAKEWLLDELGKHGVSAETYDLRALATVNGFLFLGKTSIKSAPFDLSMFEGKAKEFWTTLMNSPEWSREGTLLKEVPVLKGLAKAWFYVFIAKRNNKLAKATILRRYMADTIFTDSWIDTVPGLAEHTLAARDGGQRRLAPTHNDIVARIVTHILG